MIFGMIKSRVFRMRGFFFFCAMKTAKEAGTGDVHTLKTMFAFLISNACTLLPFVPRRPFTEKSPRIRDE
jgi:hypothetical protein